MTDPEIAVNAPAYAMPVNIVGIDEQGRPTWLHTWCDTVGWIEPDGRAVCPTCEAIGAYMRAGLERLEASNGET